MDKSKRLMTAEQAQAEERAKKSTYRSTNTTLELISPAQRPDHDDRVYQETPPSWRPPFRVEKQNMANIVGAQDLGILLSGNV